MTCRPHPCSRAHEAMVTAYRELARLWEEQAEQETGGYPGDLRAYLESHPRPQLRDFMIYYYRELRVHEQPCYSS